MRLLAGLKVKHRSTSNAKHREKKRTVNELARVVHDALDQALLLQMSNGNACQAPIDFQPLDENALADEAPCRSFLHDTVEGNLVTDDSVLGLVLDLSLRPLLLLSRFSAGRWWWSFCLGLNRRS